MAGLDLESLLSELSPDEPCGADLEYDAAYIALAEKARGTPEQQMGDRVEPAQPPNWKEVRKDALDLLQRTRDLQVIFYLIQASINTDGLPGLRDGLALLEGAVSRYWDTVYPQLDPDDDNDPTRRVNILMGLCDFETLLRPLALAPLVEARGIGRFSLRDVQIATDKLPPPEDTPKPDAATIRAAFMDAESDLVQANHKAARECLRSLTAIESFVTDQVGVGSAPNLAAARTQVKEIEHVFEQFGTGGDSGETAVAESGVAAAEGTVSRATAGTLGAIGNRQDVVRALDLICEYYARHESSSPVPLLLKRAKRLVTMDFLEIIQDLAPEGLSQIQVIKGPDPESAGNSNY